VLGDSLAVRSKSGRVMARWYPIIKEGARDCNLWESGGLLRALNRWRCYSSELWI